MSNNIKIKATSQDTIQLFNILKQEDLNGRKVNMRLDDTNKIIIIEKATYCYHCDGDISCQECKKPAEYTI